jgi:hypothetical protein
MRTPVRRRVIAAATAVIAVTAALAAPAHAATAREPVTRPPVARAAQQVFWKWSDGSAKISRTFTLSKYKDEAGLPTLVVTAIPAAPSRTVYLQFKQKGKWVVETKGTTGRKGVVRLRLNPYCSNDTWCDGVYDYRLKAGSLYQNLRITYSEK